MTVIDRICPICHNSCRFIEDKKKKIYHICLNCGFTFLDPQFHLTRQEEKARYDLHNNNPGDKGYYKWLESFAREAVYPYVKTGSRILDFGCGPEPLLAEILKKAAYSVETYDKYFDDRPFEGYYDMITSTEVLEHLSNPLLVVEQLKKHLISNGFLAFKTSLRPPKDDDFLKWWYRQDSTHISFFTEKSINSLSTSLHLSLHYCDGKSLIIFRN